MAWHVGRALEGGQNGDRVASVERVDTGWASSCSQGTGCTYSGWITESDSHGARWAGCYSLRLALQPSGLIGQRNIVIPTGKLGL